MQTFADKTLGVMAWCMPLFVAATMFGSLNGYIFVAARYPLQFAFDFSATVGTTD